MGGWEPAPGSRPDPRQPAAVHPPSPPRLALIRAPSNIGPRQRDMTTPVALHMSRDRSLRAQRSFAGLSSAGKGPPLGREARHSKRLSDDFGHGLNLSAYMDKIRDEFGFDLAGCVFSGMLDMSDWCVHAVHLMSHCL